MPIHAVLFDLDGTLLDSLADIAETANSVLESHGFASHPTDAYRHFVGDGLTRLIERVLPVERREDTQLVTQSVSEFGERYRQNWNQHSHLYDGVPEMLRALVHRGIPIAVFSNKPQEFTSCCVEHYLSEFPFVAVLGLDGRRPRKPDPTGAVEIAERFQVPSDQCLYLGDTSIDMKTARGAGMFPVGALWGFRDATELQKAGARVLISHPRDLISLIDQLEATGDGDVLPPVTKPPLRPSNRG